MDPVGSNCTQKNFDQGLLPPVFTGPFVWKLVSNSLQEESHFPLKVCPQKQYYLQTSTQSYRLYVCYIWNLNPVQIHTSLRGSAFNLLSRVSRVMLNSSSKMSISLDLELNRISYLSLYHSVKYKNKESLPPKLKQGLDEYIYPQYYLIYCQLLRKHPF